MRAAVDVFEHGIIFLDHLEVTVEDAHDTRLLLVRVVSAPGTRVRGHRTSSVIERATEISLTRSICHTRLLG